jgi:5-methylthioadenosine/S-adenosylhomocysteine deaminase
MEIVENSLIGIKDGKIVFIREKRDDLPDCRCDKRIDASGSLIMPGLINTHTHLPMVCFRGLADDLPLMDWLNNHIFPAEIRYVNRDMVHYGSILAMAEMILSGTTTFCDAYYYESSVARATLETGMRGVVCQGFIDLPANNNTKPSQGKDIAKSFVEKWTGVSPLVIPTLACHSPYTCSPEIITLIKSIAKDCDVPFLIHLAETHEELTLIKNRYGTTPVRHLHNLGVLDERTVPAHCVWVDETDTDIMADCGVKVSHIPESNMKLAAGNAPIPQMLKKGITVGLGTDGCASNNDLDMFLEMDTTAKIHKVVEMDPTVMDAETVMRMATIEGAKTLGMEASIGSIEEGKAADIIIIDTKKPHLTPLYNHYSQLVYSATGADVSTSIINGRIVMENRQLLTIDLPDIMERVREISCRIAKGID